MQLKQFITADDRAVSPVIGVILMVAITVILAAVIGTFVLGLGENVQSTSPSASISFDYDGTDLTIAHESGDVLEQSQLTINVAGTTYDEGDLNAWDGDGNSEISAGESIVIGDSGSEDLTQSLSSGDQVRVIWTSQSGDNSATLGSFEIA